MFGKFPIIIESSLCMSLTEYFNFMMKKSEDLMRDCFRWKRQWSWTMKVISYI